VRYTTADPAIVSKWRLDNSEDDVGGCGWFIDVCENHIRGTTMMSDYDLQAWACHLGIAEYAMSFDMGHHRGTDTWASYQMGDDFRNRVQAYVGQWVAYGEIAGIELAAPTFKELQAKLDAKWAAKRLQMLQDGIKYDDIQRGHFKPIYYTWIDPAYSKLSLDEGGVAP
jgi:hypothetical protein